MASQPIQPAQRIRELSDINNDVAAMLSSAGHAVNALTNRPLTSADGDAHMSDDVSSSTIEAHKEALMQHTEAYFTSLQAVFARLRRQAYALEEAGIITPDSAVPGPIPSKTGLQPGPPEGGGGAGQQFTSRSDTEHIRNGGLGNLDVGWLNSRGNKVGEEKEAELMQEAKELLKELLSRRDVQT